MLPRKLVKLMMYKEVYEAIGVWSVDQLNQEMRFVYILPVLHQNDCVSSYLKFKNVEKSAEGHLYEKYKWLWVSYFDERGISLHPFYSMIIGILRSINCFCLH